MDEFGIVVGVIIGLIILQNSFRSMKKISEEMYKRMFKEWDNT